VPIERLPKARFSEARPVEGARFERGLGSVIPDMHRPSKHHKSVIRLDPGQIGLA
jgi:hypothetical protein